MKYFSSILTLPLSAGLMLAQSQSTPTQTPTSSTQSQSSSSMNSGSGQTWTGILVASNCSASNMPRTTASSQMNRTTPSGTSNGAVSNDRSNGSSSAGKTTGDMSRMDSSATGRSGDMSRSTADRASDMNRDRARDVNQGTGTDSQLERTRTMDQTGTADRAARGTPVDTQSGNNNYQPENNQTGEMSSSGNWDRACFISKHTDSFAFQTSDGRVLNFDAAGNSQIKSQLDSTSRVATKDKIFRVRVTGTVDGDTIHLTNLVM